MRIYSVMKKMSMLLLLLAPFALQAENSLGEAADSLMTPVSIMTKLALLACYIIGIALLLASIAQYKIHRQSPKLVPLTTPITLLLLGLTAIAIPYASNMFGETYSAEQQKPSQSKSTLDLPDLNASKGPRLPNSRPKPDDRATPPPPPPSSSTPTEPPPPPPPASGGHWTDDPEYNK